jgi:hypothetical protein
VPSKTQETATAADNLLHIWKADITVDGVARPHQTQAVKDTIGKFFPGFVEAMDLLERARNGAPAAPVPDLKKPIDNT